MQDFSGVFIDLPEKELKRPWNWKDHDQEGIRFAFFVTLQELRQLAVTLGAFRSRPTPAQHILGQYHAAYMDLQAVLLGLPAEDADRPPAEGEWSVRRTDAHILGAEINFSVAVRYALEKHRAGAWASDRVPDEDENRLAGMSEEEYQTLVRGPLDGMLKYHREFHPEIISEFSNITDDELRLPATFWEETRFPIRHRLHRYEAHLVQHTVQIDKTLAAIGQGPNESKRLLRKIYAALSEAEGMLIGAEKMDETAITEAASSLSKRTREIEVLLR